MSQTAHQLSQQQQQPPPLPQNPLRNLEDHRRVSGSRRQKVRPASSSSNDNSKNCQVAATYQRFFFLRSSSATRSARRPVSELFNPMSRSMLGESMPSERDEFNLDTSVETELKRNKHDDEQGETKDKVFDESTATSQSSQDDANRRLRRTRVLGKQLSTTSLFAACLSDGQAQPTQRVTSATPHKDCSPGDTGQVQDTASSRQRQKFFQYFARRSSALQIRRHQSVSTIVVGSTGAISSSGAAALTSAASRTPTVDAAANSDKTKSNRRCQPLAAFGRSNSYQWLEAMGEGSYATVYKGVSL